MQVIYSFIALLLSLSLFAEDAFELIERGDGAFLTKFESKELTVDTTFPGKPTIKELTASYLVTEPLVHFSLIIAPYSGRPSPTITKAILDTVKSEYEQMNNKVVGVKEENPVEGNAFGISTYSTQYIIDTEDHTREFLTMTIYTNKVTDVMTLTRFIIANDLVNNIQYRVKGNSLAALFHRQTNVHYNKL